MRLSDRYGASCASANGRASGDADPAAIGDRQEPSRRCLGTMAAPAPGEPVRLRAEATRPAQGPWGTGRGVRPDAAAATAIQRRRRPRRGGPWWRWRRRPVRRRQRARTSRPDRAGPGFIRGLLGGGSGGGPRGGPRRRLRRRPRPGVSCCCWWRVWVGQRLLPRAAGRAGRGAALRRLCRYAPRPA